MGQSDWEPIITPTFIEESVDTKCTSNENKNYQMGAEKTSKNLFLVFLLLVVHFFARDRVPKPFSAYGQILAGNKDYYATFLIDFPIAIGLWA